MFSRAVGLLLAPNSTHGGGGDGSGALQLEIIYYLLGSLCLVVFVLNAVQLGRLVAFTWGSDNNQQLHYTAKKLFHFVIGVSLLGRAVFFFLLETFQDDPSFPAVIFPWLNHALEIVFFFAFFLLLIFWIDLAHSLRDGITAGGSSTNNKRRMNIAIAVFMGLLVAATIAFLFLFLFWAGNEHMNRILLLDAIFAGLVDLCSIATAVLFVVYAVMLVSLLFKRNATILHADKKRKFAMNIVVVTGICTIAFMFRSIVSIISIANEWDGSGTSKFDVPTIVLFLYFFLPENLGTTLMIYLLRVQTKAKKKEIMRGHTQTEYSRIV